MNLTPSQSSAVIDIQKYISSFNHIILRGSGGKNFLIKNLLKDVKSNLSVIEPYQIIHDLSCLLNIKLKEYCVIKDIEELYTLHKKELVSFYIKSFLSLYPDMKVIITTSNKEFKIDSSSVWYIDIDFTKQDHDHIVNSLCKNISIKELLLNLCVTSSMNDIISLIKFSHISGEDVSSMSRISSFINLNTIKQKELFGLDDQLSKVNTHIVLPMIRGIPMAKGCILYGPSGTGKTSVARWIAIQIGGRMYEIIHPQDLETVFEKAAKGKCAVFIDDVDELFEDKIFTRRFLTLLDGLSSENRDNICVIVTCMDISKIPKALMRGGRLEVSIAFELPTQEKIKELVNHILVKNNIGPIITNYRLFSGMNYADIISFVETGIRMAISSNSNDLEGMIKNIINTKCNTIDYYYS